MASVARAADQIAVRPRLVIEVELEEMVVARVLAWDFGDELRLLDELEHRPSLPREMVEALEEALELMRRRAASAVPADFTRRAA